MQERIFDPKHPVCPECGVSMWLTRTERIRDGVSMQDNYIYECKACGAAKIASEFHPGLAGHGGSDVGPLSGV